VRRHLFEHQSFEDINVTPLLDLAWTLLVVFIIAITAAVQGIQVNLPKASATPSLSKPRTKAITVQNGGQIYLDTFPVTMAELEARLNQYRAADPDFPVVIKGDSKIYYQQIIDILDLLQRLDLTQVGLVTQKLVK
jgi:biopolymer transport protein ExbD